MQHSRFSFDSTNTSWARHGFADLRDSLKAFPLAWHLSSQDIKMRYRRTVLGPFWTLINALVFVFLLGFVYSILFNVEPEEFLPYFGTGYFVWMTIFAICLESASSFVAAELIIKSMRVPFITHILRCVLRNMITFLHMIPVPIAVSLYFGVPFNAEIISKVIAGWLLMIFNGVWVALLIALISTRYRDFQQIVATILQVLFFVTPIFWMADLLNGHPMVRMILADFNPVFIQIELIRAPLIGTEISWQPYIWMGVIAVTGICVACVALGASIRRLSVWL